MKDAIVVGAGPTGLMLACWLAASGVQVRIVDPKPGPTDETRAVTLQARTIEFWKILGIAERAIEAGRRAEATNLWVGNRLAARLPLAEMGRGLSPYPYVLLIPQTITEQILYNRLRELGGEVEWETRVDSVEGNRVTIGDTSEEYRFVLGCDGASSVVRKSAGLEFPGGTYSGSFFVADIDAEGGVVPGEVNIAFQRDRFFAFFPLKAPNRYRIAGLLPAEDTVEAMRAEVERGMRTAVGQVRWFSHYRVHHRVVEHFRKGPVFLLGDAAHVHSPIGGQGMNTGLGDAVNLAWKLVEVLQYGADERLLDSYEAERRPFARSLVATTDRAFEFVVSPNPFARFLRMRALPTVLPLLLRSAAVRRLAFKTVAQTRITYRKRPLAVGAVQGFIAGDRLPPGPNERLQPNGWRLVTVGASVPQGVDWCRERGIEPEVRAGKPAVILVRPDGHIGLALDRFSAEAADRYLHETIGRPLT